MAVVTLTKSNYEKEVSKSDKPVLIDFFAHWCGPCRIVSPVVDEIAEENEQFKICKVNVDDEPELSQQFGVMSIPTLAVVKNGEVVSTEVGVRSKQAIIDMLKDK